MQINKDIRFNKPIWLPILVGTFLRIININSPILGVHSWRQADTAAIARNFAIGNSPIWLPQIDWSGSANGYVECEFPIFSYLVAQLYKLFGIHEIFGRLLALAFSVITIYLIIRIGRILIDNESGFWGGLFFACLPIGIYYGRTFQAESFLIFLASLSIDRLLAWKFSKNRINLFICWISFTLACLIKVLPFLWLGMPLLYIYIYDCNQEKILSISIIYKRLLQEFSKPGVWIFIISSFSLVSVWFLYAYLLGQSSGASFGFWGSDRSSLILIFDLLKWLDLLLRIVVRYLSILGLPLLILGLVNLPQNSKSGFFIFILLGIFASTILAIKSSFIHEYYQLPLQLFICPLMGRGIVCLPSLLKHRFVLRLTSVATICLLMAASLSIYSIDYLAVENKQADIWMPLALSIRNEVEPDSLIVSVTGLDPTLLNLARRRGWLTSPSMVNKEKLLYCEQEGAQYIAGSLQWEESYKPFDDGKYKENLRYALCNLSSDRFCPKPPNYTYLVPIGKLVD